MLHFLIDPPRTGLPDIGRAVVELALRIGVPFAVHYCPEKIPSDAWVIVYSDTSFTRKNNQRAINISPASATTTSATREEQGRIIYGRVAGQDIDEIAGAAELLTFAHEKDAARDSFGRVQANAHPLAEKGLLDETLIENAAARLLYRMQVVGFPVFQRRFAFGQQKRAVCMTHDVDGPRLLTLFQLSRVAVLSFTRKHQRAALTEALRCLYQGKPDPYWNFDGWRQLAIEAGFRSTFFVYPGKTADTKRDAKDPRYDIRSKRYANTLRVLCNDGFEIGTHHAIRTDTVAAYTAAANRMKQVTGVKPQGCRAHYWSIDWRHPHETWGKMSDSGLRYDSSLNAMNLGYRSGSMLPMLGGKVEALTPSKNPFVVIPCAVMDYYAEPRDPNDAPHARRRVEKIMHNARNGGLAVLNWHVRTLTDIGPWERLGQSARSLLARLSDDDDTVFYTCADLSAAWREHAAVLWRKA